MEIRRLSYFVSVVKHKNFTKAAQEHHMVQTAMSRQIAAIEEELGVVLLKRNNRTVLLTPAGEVFYSRALKIIELYNEMIFQTQKTAKLHPKVLEIGFGHYEHILIAQVVSEFKALYPDIDVLVAKYSYIDLITYLQAGKLDIVFSLPFSPAFVSLDETVVKQVFPSTMYLIVNKKHPIAQFDTISADLLNECTLITLSEDSGPCSLEILKQFTMAAGLNINNMINANSLESQILMVESGLGVAFLPSICIKHLTPNVKAINLKDFDPGNFVAMYQKSNENPFIKIFLQLASLKES
ncbi:LysR family transcriptional regulator [Lacrimispora saccharolytica]|uniref:Transcriptional regulator, LysR family n=1 Tax=Lacrimispora saccharolytica (strain ATCC 35040 / DSM 2544 / NRCC 2533 / WM1) TaxID=610130 RepID=D9R096_LACSW|nr:LysR family transcriptional regulator [Lacrimispora saccharolytica]ADL06329.1 transcriptional regulator, LysR family [[Clostridium] saccharolyticum WM1]QRV19572.1 LysR family transcriptional regulator [Lacrimispora saccharolytica]